MVDFNKNFQQGFKKAKSQLQKMLDSLPNKVVEVVDPKKALLSQLVKKNLSKLSTKGSKICLMQLNNILKSAEDKVKRYAEQDRLSSASIYQMLLDTYIEDTFGTDPDDDFLNVEFEEDNTDIRDLLELFPNHLFERTKYKELLTDNIKTFCKYGELFIRKFRKEGTREVLELEVLEGKYIYPVCHGSDVMFYFDIRDIEHPIPPNDIIAFYLSPETKKIVTEDGSEIEKKLFELPDEDKAQIPDSYRLGTPLLFNARDSIASCKTNTLLANRLSALKLAMPNLFTVNIENMRDEEQVDELVSGYEESIQDCINIPDEDITDYADILNPNVKFLPVEGSGKNGIAPLELNFANSDDTNDTEEKTRRRIALEAGFPPSVVSEEGETKKDSLSTQRRYRQKCKAGQRAINRPTKEFVAEDFKLQHINIEPDEYDVKCKAIVSLDTAEDLEIAIGTIQQVANTHETLKNIEENSRHLELDEEGFLEYFEGELSGFRFSSHLLKYVENKMDEEGMEGDEFGDSNMNRSGMPSLPSGESTFGDDLEDFESPEVEDEVDITEDTDVVNVPESVAQEPIEE